MVHVAHGFASVLLVVASTRLAMAQATDAAPSPSDGATELEARRLTETGLESFQRRDYETAIANFDVAYRLSPVPLLLYNIAQAERLRGGCARAREFYRKFLATEPSGKPRELAVEHERELGPCDGHEVSGAVDPADSEKTPSERSASAPEAPAPRAGKPREAAPSARIFAAPARAETSRPWNRVLAWTSFGTSAALVGVSAYFGVRASQASDDVSDVFAARGNWGPELAAREREGLRDEKISIACAVGAALFASTGTLLWIF